jgi:hypothetical protein
MRSKSTATHSADIQPNATLQDEDLAKIQGESFDCFDINLDTIPESQAAALAEKMLSMMSLVTLGETPPVLPSLQAQDQINSPVLHEAPPQEPPVPEVSLHETQFQEIPLDLAPVKQENVDEDDRATLSPPSRPVSVDLKSESSLSVLDDSIALSQSCAPTQERPSAATDLILCATVMSASKKVTTV